LNGECPLVRARVVSQVSLVMVTQARKRFLVLEILDLEHVVKKSSSVTKDS
jgi:hypothetical protein